MNDRVLVLNQDFSPMAVCSVQRAFILIYMEKAEIIKRAANRSIRTVTTSFPMPAVVRLNKYIHIPYKSVVLSRNNIFKRDNFTCQYCGSKEHLTLDHVIPRSKGGGTNWKNLITACKTCNAKKGDHSPEEIGMELENPPYKPSYLIFLRDFSGFTKDEWRPFLQLGPRVKV